MDLQIYEIYARICGEEYKNVYLDVSLVECLLFLIFSYHKSIINTSHGEIPKASGYASNIHWKFPMRVRNCCHTILTSYQVSASYNFLIYWVVPLLMSQHLLIFYLLIWCAFVKKISSLNHICRIYVFSVHLFLYVSIA